MNERELATPPKGEPGPPGSYNIVHRKDTGQCKGAGLPAWWAGPFIYTLTLVGQLQQSHELKQKTLLRF